MASSRHAIALVMRIGALFATLALLAYLIVATSFVAVTVLVAAAAVAQLASFIALVQRTHRELERLLDAIRHDDFQQSYSRQRLGPAFAHLQDRLEDVLRRFREARLDREAQRHYLEAIVEHVPIAILAVHDTGAVELLNSAARRLLDAPSRIEMAQLAGHGLGFQRDLAQADHALTRMAADGVQRTLVLSATRLAIKGVPMRLVTLQDIQRELDGSELAAWRDMARILSHEIMNSLTPISSLARTADDMVDDLAKRSAEGDELVEDIHAAIQTLARRSEGLMRFVRNYRQFTQMPPPTLRPIAVAEYLAHVEQLFAGELAERRIALHVAIAAHALTIDADESLLDQAVINLLRNAADAAQHHATPTVWLTARISDRGRPVLEVADNGPGVDEALGDQIFLPFFTTKPDGSGIGLALARQVMLVHEASITAAARPGGGALFRLTF